MIGQNTLYNYLMKGKENLNICDRDRLVCAQKDRKDMKNSKKQQLDNKKPLGKLTLSLSSFFLCLFCGNFVG